MKAQNENLGLFTPQIGTAFDKSEQIVVFHGNCYDALRSIPSDAIKLIITSPPYNLNKVYEKRSKLEKYLESIDPVLDEFVRVLSPNGSICWQVGNYIENGEVFPLDIYYYPRFIQRNLHLRNRIIWHFEHGLHASNRLSGRYETLLWFTKTDEYTFNLDSVRVPAKYPGKRHYKGDRYGQPSGNPLGKNPSDVWKIIEKEWEAAFWTIPNVKSNHAEKTIHPCQFPIELVERCVLALTDEDDWLLDPFSGVGSALLAALRHNRRAIGCEKEASYAEIAKKRILDFYEGKLPYRPLGKPVHKPTGREKVAQWPEEWSKAQEIMK